MRRRTAAAALATLALPVAGRPAAAPADADPRSAAEAALRRGGGGLVVLLRHATAPGLGDPSEFATGDCRTQRNLDLPGRDQAARVGAWYRGRGLTPRAVRTSPFCRCIDTAALAFPDTRAEVWPALGSFIRDRAAEPAQTATLRAELRRLAEDGAAGFEVWVTHMVNVFALVGVDPQQGEGILVRHDPRLRRIETIGRLREG